MFEITNTLGAKTQASTITACSTSMAKAIFLNDGKLVPPPAAEVAQVSRNELQFFCLTHGIYSLPTAELIEFVSDLIPNKDKAIEIGSGNGTYARNLGIIGTDNFMQHPKNRGKFNNVLSAYEKMGQVPVQYGDDVIELDARDAVRKYKPETVVCAWVTHKFDRSKPEIEGNMFGVDFKWIAARNHVKRIILIGNDFTHSQAPLMKVPHDTHNVEFQYSRSQFPELDRVYVWDV